ncbi:uncharacterized protein [Parasteatoda tepidariorum]|uniref:uncharacterized protein n=1 Tax=Parasteatoda tepidariorum TaxID=114398 RepID=UPI0039BD8D8C
MADKLISWNCRGFYVNFPDIKNLIEKHNPACFALQETFLKPNHKANVQRYSHLRKDFIDGNKACGGVSLLISKSYPFSPVLLTTTLQAVAAQVTFQSKLITICSLYLPPNQSILQSDLNKLIAELPQPFIITGDLNGHSITWGSDTTNSRGNQIETLIDDHQLCILNTDEKTHFHFPSRTFHSIDLTLCSPRIYTLLKFFVWNDLYHSDHFPLIINILKPGNTNTVHSPRLLTHLANWTLFQESLAFDEEIVYNGNIEEAAQHITNSLISASENSIPRTSNNLPKYPKPWWNEECRQTHKAQRRVWRIFRRHPTVENLILFKKSRAFARKTGRQSQRESWIKYISTINNNTKAKEI